MANWFERARREIPLIAERRTANTDDRSPMAVTAVPQPDKNEISASSIGSNGSTPATDFRKIERTDPLDATEAQLLRAWLAHINETDPATIAQVLDQCRNDQEAKLYFLKRAGEIHGDR